MKTWLKKNAAKLAGIVLISVVLIAAYLSGGKLENKDGNTSSYRTTSETFSDVVSNIVGEADSDTDTILNTSENTKATDTKQDETDKHTETESESSLSVVEKPSEPSSEINKETESDTRKVPYCTVSISCNTILSNMDRLDKSKKSVIPNDGMVLNEIRVDIQENDTVFSILKRVCRENNIHLEASYTPVYNTAYIEGIGNIYEFDCGSLSGWMYSVNGVFADCSSSEYPVNDKDVIKWVYTCDLGRDVK